MSRGIVMTARPFFSNTKRRLYYIVFLSENTRNNAFSYLAREVATNSLFYLISHGVEIFKLNIVLSPRATYFAKSFLQCGTECDLNYPLCVTSICVLPNFSKIQWQLFSLCFYASFSSSRSQFWIVICRHGMLQVLSVQKAFYTNSNFFYSILPAVSALCRPLGGRMDAHIDMFGVCRDDQTDTNSCQRMYKPVHNTHWVCTW